VVHTGATWQIPLSRPCVAVNAGLLLNYLDHLLVCVAVAAILAVISA